MNEAGTAGRIQEREKEIVNILIDSDLYLEMDIRERKKLLLFIEAAYFNSSAK